MRLKKQEREDYIRQIKEYKSKKVLSAADVRALESAWRNITWDHYDRLRLDLDHISDLFLWDSMGLPLAEMGVLHVSMADAIRHYDQSELKRTLERTGRAARSLQRLEQMIIAEQRRRAGKTGRKASIRRRQP